jgi:hypothetical protein
VGQLPHLSTVEKNFLAQLIMNPTKEVNVRHFAYVVKWKNIYSHSFGNIIGLCEF